MEMTMKNIIMKKMHKNYKNEANKVNIFILYVKNCLYISRQAGPSPWNTSNIRVMQSNLKWFQSTNNDTRDLGSFSPEFHRSLNDAHIEGMTSCESHNQESGTNVRDSSRCTNTISEMKIDSLNGWLNG